MTDDEGYLLAQYFSRIQKLWLILKFGIKFVFVTLLAAKNKMSSSQTANLPLSVTKVIC